MREYTENDLKQVKMLVGGLNYENQAIVASGLSNYVLVRELGSRLEIQAECIQRIKEALGDE